MGSPPVSARGYQVQGEATRGQSPGESCGERREAAGAGRCRASLEGRFAMQVRMVLPVPYAKNESPRQQGMGTAIYTVSSLLCEVP